MPIFNDEFNIDDDYQKMKNLAIHLEKDIYNFIGPNKNKSASIRARKQLREIKTLCANLRKAISNQRAHNDSEY